MFRGPATINLFAAEMPAAIEWYTELFDAEPYFVRPEAGPPAYAEWRIGDLQTEVGLIDAPWAPYPVGEPSGAVVNWAVDDLASTRQQLLDRGAQEIQPVIDRGDGFFTTVLADPFGNVLGLMTNPHYADMVARLS